jgi:hypothetical protein
MTLLTRQRTATLAAGACEEMMSWLDSQSLRGLLARLEKELLRIKEPVSPRPITSLACEAQAPRQPHGRTST